MTIIVEGNAADKLIEVINTAGAQHRGRVQRYRIDSSYISFLYTTCKARQTLSVVSVPLGKSQKVAWAAQVDRISHVQIFSQKAINYHRKELLKNFSQAACVKAGCGDGAACALKQSHLDVRIAARDRAKRAAERRKKLNTKFRNI